MRAAVLRGPGDVVVEERPVPEPGPGEVLVRVTAVGCAAPTPTTTTTGGSAGTSSRPRWCSATRLGTTTVYVTHDQVEAMTMGDRVAVLRAGVLEQCDTPLRLYQEPADVFVAGFIGSPGMNLADFALDDGHAVLGRARIPVPTAALSALSREGARTVVAGFRPESLELVGEGEPGAFPVDVTVVEELGSDAFLHGSLPDLPPDSGTLSDSIIARVDPTRPPAEGERVHLRIQPDREHLFSPSSGRRLPAV